MVWIIHSQGDSVSSRFQLTNEINVPLKSVIVQPPKALHGSVRDFLAIEIEPTLIEDTWETDLGYRIKKAFWGKGYGTEAASMCIKDGFTRLHLQRIYAEAYAENIGSIRIMEKVGMKYLKDTILEDAPGKVYEMLKTNYK